MHPEGYFQMVVPLEFGIDGAGLMTEALLHMRIALDLVDRSRAPADIGAYLDLAMVKLQDAIPAEAKPSSSCQ
jgi:hypothetical protein